MTTERKGLNFDSLSEFAPRPPKQEQVVREEREIVEKASTWDSREIPADVQLNMRAHKDVARAFKQLCKQERRTYGDMLRVLMEERDERAGG